MKYKTIDELMLKLEIYQTINLCIKDPTLEDIIKTLQNTIDSCLSIDTIVD